MGDFVKGKQVEQYEPMIQKGIWLHREIDHYTDTHPVVLQTKTRLRPHFRHYAGVVSDIFYDHFLAIHWETYGVLSLDSFAAKAYASLTNHKTLLPEKAQFMLPYMIQHNWLVHYQYIEGIRRSLTGMARRTGFKSGMEHAHLELERNFEAYEKEFHEFFPQLVEHSRRFIANFPYG